MLSDIPLSGWLGFAVLSAIVSTVGALIGVLLKDYFFTRSFERWKQKQALETIYEKYRDPLFLSARELASRTREILDHYPTVYLTDQVYGSRPERQIDNSIDDPYFRRYKLVSTLYRVCAFFGWLELYRQESTYLHAGDHNLSLVVENVVDKIRGDLADGQLNLAKNWNEWRDTLVFREELRAVGDSMIETRGTARTVMGYCRFAELLDSDQESAAKRWSNVIRNFLLGLESKDDFRKVRLWRLLIHLVELMECLDSNLIEAALLESREKWSKLEAERIESVRSRAKAA